MFEIVKDDILKCWIVWEVHRNIKIDVFHARTKKECKQWISNIK